MSAARDDSFFVGYLPSAPPDIGRFVQLAVLAFLLVTLGVAALWATSQRTWQASAFEFGVEREFTGTYLHGPVPHLRVARPGADAGFERWLLVSESKRGGSEAWAEFDGSAVKLLGSLVHRSEGTLLQVATGTLSRLDAPGRTPAAGEEFGRVQLAGEIVDSKCWFGVMNPGNLRTHRACAILCVRGGIPPLLVVRTPDHPARQVLLVGPGGEAINADVLPWIALPVEVAGELSRHDDLWVLRTDPGTIQSAP